MTVLAAEDRLRAGVSDAALFDTVVEATGSKWVAAKALGARLHERLRRGETPGEA